MTKEEVLQKVNDYCNEKSYTSATLTDDFKGKFAEHFQKANAEGDINDENIINALKFAINTAFSSASMLATLKGAEFANKEKDYTKQIEELTKKVKDGSHKEPTLSKEVQEQLAELAKFKTDAEKKAKFNTIIELSKKNIRTDLHTTFDKFAKNYEVVLDKEEQEQADGLVSKFQDLMMDSIGNIKPLAPHVVQKKDEEFISSLPKYEI